jgi:hypothetical protein
METLKYSSDQNNVLRLECFPSVRIDKGKYALGGRYLLQKGNRVLGIVQCVRHQSIYMRHVTDSLSFTITGKEAPYMQEVMRRMYPGTDWQRERISYMHFRWVERYPDHQPVAVQTSLEIGCRRHRDQV